MSGPDREPTVEELGAVADDAANSVDEAMNRLFVALGPHTVLSSDDESER